MGCGEKAKYVHMIKWMEVRHLLGDSSGSIFLLGRCFVGEVEKMLKFVTVYYIKW